MADDKKKRGGADRGLIALSEPYEVAYWSKKFKITPAKLKTAVKKVGHSAKKVDAYIKLQKHKAVDRARIAMSQPYEVSYWSKKFKVTPARLKAAVAAVGHSSKAVGAHLAKGKRRRRRRAPARLPGKPQRSAQRKRPPSGGLQRKILCSDRRSVVDRATRPNRRLNSRRYCSAARRGRNKCGPERPFQRAAGWRIAGQRAHTPRPRAQPSPSSAP